MKIIICAQVVDKEHAILGFFHEWIVEFSRHFSEVEVLCLQEGVYDFPPNVSVYSLGKDEGKGRITYVLRFYWYFTKLFFSTKPDFVFFHMGAVFNFLAAPFFWVRKLYGTKFYWWKAHGHINWWGRQALRFVDRVYTSTETGFSIATDKRRVVGQAIDETLFDLPKVEARKKTIVYVGRVVPLKRLEVFVETAVLLESLGYSFVVIGPHDSAEYVAQLQAEDGGGSVKWLEPKTQTELVAVYQSATFFLNSSCTNSMDKTVLEAGLCGCVPVTANPAFVELLQPHDLLASAPTAEQYAAIITKLDGLDRSQLQQQLRHEIIMRHSLNTFFTRIFNYD